MAVATPEGKRPKKKKLTVGNSADDPYISTLLSWINITAIDPLKDHNSYFLAKYMTQPPAANSFFSHSVHVSIVFAASLVINGYQAR